MSICKLRLVEMASVCCRKMFMSDKSFCPSICWAFADGVTYTIDGFMTFFNLVCFPVTVALEAGHGYFCDNCSFACGLSLMNI